MNTINFCTLFDLRYSSRGLALYKSLERHCKDFHLFALAMDDAASALLASLSPSNMTVISLAEFENAELSQAKATRTWQEYCWTCTPALLRFCINSHGLTNCTYLDADIFFFDDPRIILDQLPREKTVLITPHHYAKEYDQSATSGIFCVQFVTFKNESRALNVLEKWYNQCIEWCYARFEDGKFGDQKYLDSWPQEYDCVEVSDHFGVGAAPWNIKKYDVADVNGEIALRSIETKQTLPLFFYHFHDLYFNERGAWYHKSGNTGYQIAEDAYTFIYAHYLRQLRALGRELGFPAGIDFPRLPGHLSVSDFETIIVPRTKSLGDKVMLRESYIFAGKIYEAIALAPDKRDQLFELLIAAQYNLSSATLWETPENRPYQSIRQMRTRLQKLEDNALVKILLKLRNVYIRLRRSYYA